MNSRRGSQASNLFHAPDRSIEVSRQTRLCSEPKLKNKPNESESGERQREADPVKDERLVMLGSKGVRREENAYIPL